MRDDDDKTLNKRVGEWLRMMRREYQPGGDTSLAEIEEGLIGKMKGSTLGSYERGEREPPVTKVLRLARFYPFSLDAMLDYVWPNDRDTGGPAASDDEAEDEGDKDDVIDLTAPGPLSADRLKALTKLSGGLRQIADDLGAVTALAAVDDKNSALAGAIAARAGRAYQGINMVGRLLQQASAILEANAS